MIILHILAISVTGLTVLYSDEQGLMWMLGKKELLDAKRIELLHTIVSIGLALVILTGGLMALRGLTYYLQNPVFLIKMGFVFVLIVNGLFIGKIASLATTRSFASLTSRERLPLLVSGAASVMGWAGALLAGLLLGG
ncbi:MAG: hypothetical protein KA104_01160 [Candidatus Pacebacteria bacterium]|nr:hypothetical protein [Candidatus Paceibacterota bacterium]